MAAQPSLFWRRNGFLPVAGDVDTIDFDVDAAVESAPLPPPPLTPAILPKVAGLFDGRSALIDPEGFAFVRSGGDKATWQKRWMLIQNGLLLYYKNATTKTTNYKGEVDLADCIVRRATCTTGEDHTLAVVPHSNDADVSAATFIRFEDDIESETWFSALSKYTRDDVSLCELATPLLFRGLLGWGADAKSAAKPTSVRLISMSTNFLYVHAATVAPALERCVPVRCLTSEDTDEGGLGFTLWLGARESVSVLAGSPLAKSQFLRCLTKGNTGSLEPVATHVSTSADLDLVGPNGAPLPPATIAGCSKPTPALSRPVGYSVLVGKERTLLDASEYMDDEGAKASMPGRHKQPGTAQVVVDIDVAITGAPPWRLSRFYVHLLLLQRDILHLFPGLMLPTLPPSRLDAFETYPTVPLNELVAAFLDDVLSVPAIANCEPIISFFELNSLHRAVSAASIAEVIEREGRDAVSSQGYTTNAHAEGVKVARGSGLAPKKNNRNRSTTGMVSDGVLARPTAVGDGLVHIQALLEMGVQISLPLPLPADVYVRGHPTELNSAYRSGTATPLLVALAYDSASVVAELLAAGAALDNSQSNKGWTPLHGAARFNAVRSLELLMVSEGMVSNVDVCDTDFLSPVHHAAARGHVDVLKCLVEAGSAAAHLELWAGVHAAPVWFAARAGHDDATAFLISASLSAGESKNILEQPDEVGYTLAHYAAMAGMTQTLELLVGAGVRMNVVDEEGNTPFLAALAGGQLETARGLMNGTDDAIANYAGQTGAHVLGGTNHPPKDARLVAAAIAGVDLSASTVLLNSRGVGVGVIGLEGDRGGVERSVDAITKLKQGGGMLTDHASVTQRAVLDDIVARLLKAGVDLNGYDGEGATPLIICAEVGAANATSALIAAGAEPNKPVKDGLRAPIHVAAEWGTSDVLSALIRAGANIEVPDSTGLCPIHIAVAFNNVDAAATLVAAGVDTSAHNPSGDAPLHAACRAGSVPLVKLLAPICDLDQIQASGNQATALHIAVERENTGAVGVLLGSGASADVQDKDGVTPVMLAAKFAAELGDPVFHQLAILLATAGGNVDRVSNEKLSAIDYAPEGLKESLQQYSKMWLALQAHNLMASKSKKRVLVANEGDLRIEHRATGMRGDVVRNVATSSSTARATQREEQAGGRGTPGMPERNMSLPTLPGEQERASPLGGAVLRGFALPNARDTDVSASAPPKARESEAGVKLNFGESGDTLTVRGAPRVLSPSNEGGSGDGETPPPLPRRRTDGKKGPAPLKPFRRPGADSNAPAAAADDGSDDEGGSDSTTDSGSGDGVSTLDSSTWTREQKRSLTPDPQPTRSLNSPPSKPKTGKPKVSSPAPVRENRRSRSLDAAVPGLDPFTAYAGSDNNTSPVTGTQMKTNNERKPRKLKQYASPIAGADGTGEVPSSASISRAKSAASQFRRCKVCGARCNEGKTLCGACELDSFFNNNNT